jgi:hypothetical protein
MRFTLILTIMGGLLGVPFGAIGQSCPPHSHASSQGNGRTTCVCDSGYTWSGGQCVPR